MDQWSVFFGIQVQRKDWPNSKNLVLVVGKEKRNLISKIDDYVKHRKIIVDRSGNTER